MRSRTPSILLAAASSACLSAFAIAGPQVFPWIVEGPDDTAGVAAAALSGVYAFSDSYEDSVEVRWPDGALRATITRERIAPLVPWMELNGSADGVGAVALSDSGRLLFIAVHDANVPPGPPLTSDAILRYDIDTGVLTLFARMEFGSSDATWPHEALLFHNGRLYVGGSAALQVYRAQANDTTGTLLSSAPLSAGPGITGLAIDRSANTLYMTQGTSLYRGQAGDSVTLTRVGTLPAEAVGLAFSEHYGGQADAGLYWVDSSFSAPAFYRVWRVPTAQARGQQAFNPTLYLGGLSAAHDLAMTADGALLLATDEDAALVRDTGDTLLSFQAWAADEFAQNVLFARALITTSPAGWVIDADVTPGGSRFHPASPDAAAWAVFLLMMNERLTGDALAERDVALILRRYAGRSPDLVRPLRSADGMYWHWLEPATGGAKPGWGDGFATMSTMKIVLAAVRAKAFYPANADIQASADAIICGVSNWDAYFNLAGQMALLGRASGGAETTTWSAGFHEGILFTDQARAYGGPVGQGIGNSWMTRSSWPTASLVSGRGVSGQWPGQFLPAFVTIYPWLLLDEFRSDAAWTTNMANLRVSHAAWTDDHAPRLATVFSAGTTAPEWGGYHADSLSDHPGDVTTLAAVLALASGSDGSPRLPEAYAAYHAYRMGARQAFLGGASLLYRRSNVTPSYTPNSAGLPDVAMGALGLAEVLAQGSVREVLAASGRPYPSCDPCGADFNGDGFVDFFDYDDYVVCYETGSCPPGRSADFNGDEFVDFFDYDDFVASFERGC